MATKRNATTERIVFESAEGRVRVVKYGPQDHGLFLDGVCVGSYDYCYQAQYEGALWLAEQAQALTATLADEAAQGAQAEQCDQAEDVPLSSGACLHALRICRRCSNGPAILRSLPPQRMGGPLASRSSPNHGGTQASGMQRASIKERSCVPRERPGLRWGNQACSPSASRIRSNVRLRLPPSALAI